MRIISGRSIGVSVGLLAMAFGAAIVLPGPVPVSKADDGGPRAIIERTRTLELPGGRVLTVTAMLDPELVDPDAAMDELVPGSVPGAEGGGASAAFAIFDIWDKADIPVVIHYSPDGAPAPQGIAYTGGLVQAAVAKWNDAGSGFRLVYGELTSPVRSQCDSGNGNDDGDGVNTIQWRSNLRPGVLGSTCTVTAGRINGELRVIEADIVFSTQWKWSFGDDTPADAYDWRSNLLHELGHVVGLNHSRVEGNVMLASLARGVQRRTPTQDDIDGVRSLYGPGPAPAPPPAPQVPATPPGLTKRATTAVLAHGY